MIVSLGFERQGYRTTRHLEVIKMRGGSCPSGSHAYEISGDGSLRRSPHRRSGATRRAYERFNERVSTGIAAIDALIHDGYWPGATTLIAGPTGVGKTLMALHFLFHGAAEGEPGILATLQESRASSSG